MKKIVYVADLDQDIDDIIAVDYLNRQNVLEAVVLDPLPKDEDGRKRLEILRQKEIKVSADALTSILDTYPELSAEWLMRGKGPMLSSGTSDDDLTALAGVVSDLTETLKEKNKIIAMLHKHIDESKNN